MLVCFYLLGLASLNAQTNMISLNAAHMKDLSQNVQHLLLIDEEVAIGILVDISTEQIHRLWEIEGITR